MAEIEITEQGARFRVKVSEADGETTHDVGVPEDYVAEIGLVHADRSELVKKSFQFLLEREPKESIMRTFDLPVIERYFREYPQEIRRRLTDQPP